jgi:hypothetical protein
MIGGNRKMIKEKYMQLLLHAQMGGITTIDDTHTLCFMLKEIKGIKHD